MGVAPSWKRGYSVAWQMVMATQLGRRAWAWRASSSAASKSAASACCSMVRPPSTRSRTMTTKSGTVLAASAMADAGFGHSSAFAGADGHGFALV